MNRAASRRRGKKNKKISYLVNKYARILRLRANEKLSLVLSGFELVMLSPDPSKTQVGYCYLLDSKLGVAVNSSNYNAYSKHSEKKGKWGEPHFIKWGDIIRVTEQKTRGYPLAVEILKSRENYLKGKI